MSKESLLGILAATSALSGGLQTTKLSDDERNLTDWGGTLEPYVKIKRVNKFVKKHRHAKVFPYKGVKKQTK